MWVVLEEEDELSCPLTFASHLRDQHVSDWAAEDAPAEKFEQTHQPVVLFQDLGEL